MATKTSVKKVVDNGASNRISDVLDSTTAQTQIVIPQLKLGEMRLRLTGTTALITHKWSSKALKQMLDKQMKKAKSGREAKCPEEDFIESMYWLDGKPPEPIMDPKTGSKTYDMAALQKAIANAKFGFPACAVKHASVGACRFLDDLNMTQARGAFRVYGAEDPSKVAWNPREMLLIQGDKPIMREDPVRLAKGGSADLRYRGEFVNWYTDILVIYNAGFFSAAQVVNLIHHGGFSQGMGEWRPERDGDKGTYTVSGI